MITGVLHNHVCELDTSAERPRGRLSERSLDSPSLTISQRAWYFHFRQKHLLRLQSYVSVIIRRLLDVCLYHISCGSEFHRLADRYQTDTPAKGLTKWTY